MSLDQNHPVEKIIKSITIDATIIWLFCVALHYKKNSNISTVYILLKIIKFVSKQHAQSF